MISSPSPNTGAKERILTTRNRPPRSFWFERRFVACTTGESAPGRQSDLPRRCPRVYVIGSGLSVPPGKALQLWAVRGAQQIPEGLLHGDSSGVVLSGVIAAIREGHVDAFGVTVEPTGGASGTHGPVVLYGKLL